MGVTYKAFDVDLRCPVTLKVISEKYIGDESARLRFLREARAAASVRHPNVASVLIQMERIIGITDRLCERANGTVEGEYVYTVVSITEKNDVSALEFYNLVSVGFFFSFSTVRAIIITSYDYRGTWCFLLPRKRGQR